MRHAHRKGDWVGHIRPCPQPGGGELWTEAEEALLGTAADLELAERLGRARNAVGSARRRKSVSHIVSVRVVS
jgi:hypothetical protein